MGKWEYLAIGLCLCAVGAQAGQPVGSRLFFPITIEAPETSVEPIVQPGSIAYRQNIHAEKAVRLTAPHLLRFQRPEDKTPIEINLPDRTLFVVARGESGEMYCMAIASDTNILATILLGRLITAFHDTGICIRDTNFDGKFDQQIVFDQAPYRTRTAFEILGTKDAVWEATTLEAEQVDSADIPRAEIRILYEHFSGGLFGKPFGRLQYRVCWSSALVSTGAHDVDGKSCANLRSDADGTGLTIGAEEGARSTVSAAPFIVETLGGKAGSLAVTVKKSLAPGPGVLLVSGRLYRPALPKFQETIIDIFATKTSVGSPPQI